MPINFTIKGHNQYADDSKLFISSLNCPQSPNLHIHLPAWFLYLICNWPLTLNQILEFSPENSSLAVSPRSMHEVRSMQLLKSTIFSFSSSLTSSLSACSVGIDSKREFAVWLRKLKQGLFINLDGWDGREIWESFKREGTYV